MFKGLTHFTKKMSKDNPNLPLDTKPHCTEELTPDLQLSIGLNPTCTFPEALFLNTKPHISLRTPVN